MHRIPTADFEPTMQLGRSLYDHRGDSPPAGGATPTDECTASRPPPRHQLVSTVAGVGVAL